MADENTGEGEGEEEIVTPAEGEEKPSGEAEEKPAGEEEKPEGEKEEDDGKKDEEEHVPLTAEDLEVPDGLELDEELSGEFMGILDNKDLSTKEMANALLNLQSKALNSATEKFSEIWATTQKDWRDEVSADPEFAGDKLEPALANINQLVTKYGDDGLKQMLDITGAGNNIAMVRFLNKIAVDFGLEGDPVIGTPPGEGGNKTQAERLYPSK